MDGEAIASVSISTFADISAPVGELAFLSTVSCTLQATVIHLIVDCTSRASKQPAIVYRAETGREDAIRGLTVEATGCDAVLAPGVSLPSCYDENGQLTS